MGDGDLLGDHSAKRMTDQVRALDEHGVEQTHGGIGEGGKGDLGKRRRLAIARHLPGEMAKPRPAGADLGIEAGAVAADAVQIEDGLGPVAGKPMGGRQEVAERGHASAPCSTPASTTASPSRLTVQLRSGRSKCPAVCRPATSLAPVE